MLSDLRYALRQLLKSPGFTFVAVLTLGLAIGVNSAAFAIVHRVFLRPPVARDPASVVGVFNARKGEKAGYRQFSHAEYSALRGAGEAFSEVSAVQLLLGGLSVDKEPARRALIMAVSENYFSLFGADLAQGRTFTPEESRPGAKIAVLVASDGLWRKMGGRSDFLGSTYRVNGHPFTVIGIAPKGFSGGHALVAPEVWLPLGAGADYAGTFGGATEDLANPRVFALNLVARLAPGLTRESAAARLPALDRRLAEATPADSGGPRELGIAPVSRFNISTEPEGSSDPVGLIAAAILAMAGVVLVIAGLNLANLLLARGAARRREIAVRLAVGAQRGRIVRQLVTEGFVLALLGGLLGITLAFWANRALLASLSGLFQSMSFSFVLDFTPDGPFLAATLAFCVVATLIFSLGPALRLSRADLAHDLKPQADDAAGGGWRRLFTARGSLVMAQVALSLALVFCAALFLRGGSQAASVSPGFNPAGVFVAEADYGMLKLSPEAARPRLLRLRDAVAAMPGVEGVALDANAPYNNEIDSRRVVPAGEAAGGDDPAKKTLGAVGIYHRITAGYFRVMSVPLLSGRDFNPGECDQPDAARVAIVDEKLAKRLFPDGSSPLGRKIVYSTAEPDGSRPEMEIVGVVRNTRYETLGVDSHAHLYLPFAQQPPVSGILHVKLSNASPAATAAFGPALRRALQTADADAPLLLFAPLADVMDRNIGLWLVRTGAALFGAFGAVALLIAAIGVYGVHSYTVARRTRELGVRMALGAQPGDVLRLVLGHGARQTVVALGIGLLLSLGLGQLLSAMLYQVSPFDPLALGGAVVVLGGAALLACWLPARRATRVNPMTALRSE